MELRAEFPVLGRASYLNAGMSGPVPRRALEAVRSEMRAQAELGRGAPGFSAEHLEARLSELRSRIAALLGCTARELALTASTTDGIARVLSALELGPGDEVLTSDEEHPGLVAPLAAGSAHRGFEVKVAPFAALAQAASTRTRLVACSHVSWLTGKVADAPALAGLDAPLLLDGAQALGAIPVDVAALRCDFYAASGQKWLCGPNGVGYLYVRGERIRPLLPAWPGFENLAAPDRPMDLALHDSARRFDSMPRASEAAAWALASLDTLEAGGMQAVLDRGRELAAALAEKLRRGGAQVAPRGDSTLVSWRASRPEAAVERLARKGFLLRSMAGHPWVRASVGAWSSEEELEGLARLVSRAGPQGLR